MWILESDGDFLQGKRVWLRPGQKYLFGRISQGGVRHAIDHSTISRKHLVVEVAPVKPGDGSRVHTRPRVILTDLSSKCGTQVDGESIKGTTKEVCGDEHIVKLGRYQHVLRVKWHPIVLSFSFSTKELKAKDPLVSVRSRLEDLDVKVIVPYIVGSTTHVVQNKRNTAKGLQALINGVPIVDNSYVDALVYAATPNDLESEEALSPLEQDFDASWPDPVQYLPPSGKEPSQRPDSAFHPDTSRLDVFEGYTFVFCDSGQFENLQGPIANGHGKALLYKIKNGETTADEIVQYMRNVAGEKTFAGENPDETGGVILVRFRGKGQFEDWSIQLNDHIAQSLDQRVIEQSEFLDAILGNDAAPLRRALPLAPASSQSPDVPISQPTDLQNINDSEDVTVSQVDPSGLRNMFSRQPVERRTNRSQSRPFVSKVKNFDDGFDMESVPVYNLEEETTERISQAAESQGGDEQRESLKRPALDEEDDVVSDLLPGAAAMKKRRIATGRGSREPSQPLEPVPKPKRQKFNVLEAARQRREVEEEAAREQHRDEDDSIQATLDSMDTEQMKNLAIVEVMEVPIRSRQQTPNNEERWNDQWNGRKDFKKFRRKGDANRPQHRIQAVIVPLEEVRTKNFGIGEEYRAGSRDRDRDRDRDTVGKRDKRENSGSHVGDSMVISDSEPAEPVQLVQPSTRTKSKTPSLPARKQSQKRPRGADSDDDDDSLKFRFRRRK